MKKLDLYQISLKVLGMFLFFQGVLYLNNTLGLYFLFYANPDSSEANPYRYVIIASFVNLIVATLVSYLLIFKTEYLVRATCKKLDFENEITVPAIKRDIYEIVLVIIGLLMVVWSLPTFAYHL